MERSISVYLTSIHQPSSVARLIIGQSASMTREELRLKQSCDRSAHWKRWGPYVSERAWGTVREDYSPYGTAWNYLTHDQARSKAYRWNEDGLAGLCDRHQNICFAIALWNGQDPILKERLFGLNGNEGNHGEDVKECYYYLDSTPTHSYMKMLYKYPQKAFPYTQLVEENRKRDRSKPEYELIDTGIFDDNRYFDVFVEYAKAEPDDICIQISVANRGPAAADIDLLPTVWFRNTWSWKVGDPKPALRLSNSPNLIVELDDLSYGRRWLSCDGSPTFLFTENETNYQRLFNTPNPGPYVKDAFHSYVVQGNKAAVNPAREGTKAAAHYHLRIDAGASATVRLRLCDVLPPGGGIGTDFNEVLSDRRADAAEFYETIIPQDLSADGRNVMRQAFAGLLWSKQFYHYVVKDWLDGDPAMPTPPVQRKYGRNDEWTHLFNADVISMPDKWEYPWYAAWDLAFHCLPLALVDCDFAKEQLILMLREWYMHPNGQLPAYEWALGDVNPPVHAWAALRVYRIERKRTGKADRNFLERVFHKLMINFTWWVNRKDSEGRNIFQGGFLGLDNIGLFDRSKPLPTGGHIEQADGTGWMAMYTLNLLAIALELAAEDPTYEDVASKFWEHFLYIAHAVNHLGADDSGMWSEEDNFFYDVLHTPDGQLHPMKLRSIVGLIPLYAVTTLDPEVLGRLKGFRRRMNWFLENRDDLIANVASMRDRGQCERQLLSIVGQDQLRNILRVVLDENEFLSPFGLRALSRYHRQNPYVMQADGAEYRVDYEPAESRTGLFGGNSNWRGPIWFPVNYLLIESLQRFDFYFGPSFQVECPTGSGKMMTLAEVAAELSRRLTRLFTRDDNGRRPAHGADARYADDPHWKDLVLFYEYFDGDTGAGLGANHQTGWTGLVAKMMQQSGE